MLKVHFEGMEAEEAVLAERFFLILPPAAIFI